MLWDMLEKLCIQLTNEPLQINVFHVDFEKAAHNAVLEKFPNCVIVCCNFHLGQSWYRRIQQNKLLLKEYLNKSSEIGTWLKCFFGLSYLPPNEISDGFTDLLSIAPTNMFTEFTDYILENYILPDSDFPPVMWASAPIENYKKLWTNPRDAFRRAAKKSVTKSGQKSKNIKKWKYEDEMSFLRPHMKEKDSISNIESMVSDDDDSDDNEDQCKESENLNSSSEDTHESIQSPNSLTSTLQPFRKPVSKNSFVSKKKKSNYQITIRNPHLKH
ncbi:hypothetical protein QTP88_010287 [Uroleucon formosanum]